MSTSIKVVAICGAFLFLAMSATYGLGQSVPKQAKEFPLWKFDELTKYPSCRAKGRLQDRGYCESKLMDQVLAEGKNAIPVLISQLTDTRKTRTPIYDYWNYTNAGDIAFFILSDLFTASDWKTINLPGVKSPWKGCNEAAESCWRRFVMKYGRKGIQKQWQAAWDMYQADVYWDKTESCFRIRKKRQ